MTAPGEGIYVARRSPGSDDLELIETSNGTSHTTTAIAAASANWLAFHGRSKLELAKGDYSMTELFRFVLAKSVNTPEGWDIRRYGPGILDLEKLLTVIASTFPYD